MFVRFVIYTRIGLKFIYEVEEGISLVPMYFFVLLIHIARQTRE